MDVFLKLTLAGTDTGPFDIYSNSDDYETPIETNIQRTLLVNGYVCQNVPSDAKAIMVKSLGSCTNSAIALISINSPSPTPITPTPTSTPTPTPNPTPTPVYGHVAVSGDEQYLQDICFENVNIAYYGINPIFAIGDTVYLNSNLTIHLTGNPIRWKKISISSYPDDPFYMAVKVNSDGKIINMTECYGW